MIVYWNLSNALRYLGEHEEAYLQLRRVSKMMNDDSICDDATNSSDWFFDTATDGSDSGALFEDLQQKRLYSKYSLALSACLTGRESEAEQALDDASGMECDLREPAVKFLSANIAKLRSVDENLTEPLNAFCGKLMERIDGASFKRFLLLFRQF